MAFRYRRATVVALAMVLAALTPMATGCSGGAVGRVDYAGDGALSTYNTNTVAGASSAGAAAAASRDTRGWGG